MRQTLCCTCPQLSLLTGICCDGARTVAQTGYSGDITLFIMLSVRWRTHRGNLNSDALPGLVELVSAPKLLLFQIWGLSHTLKGFSFQGIDGALMQMQFK